MKNTKNAYNYRDWGESINVLRSSLGIPVKTLCTDCNISARTYYEILRGWIRTSVITYVSWTICTTSS